jgi:flagellar hook protein FlgE
MDVIANNISNVNTVGFKASRTIFQDVYSQTSRGAAAASVVSGGTNPLQIGLGVKLAAIDVLHSTAATQRTDRELDFAIAGDGFFVVKNGDNTYYTRAGNFYIDSGGNLVTASGDYVQGVMANITTPGTATTPPITDDPLLLTATPDADGDLVLANPLENINTLNEYINISIGTDGLITGIRKDDPTGTKIAIAAIAIATVVNPSGLEKRGESLYAVSPNSGPAKAHAAGQGGAGKMEIGGLEMSNVDLSGEFTDMIVTQRGFQANSRIITVSDTLLEELINLKR